MSKDSLKAALDLEALRRREVQMMGAAISTRSWHDMENAYNQLRDKIDTELTRRKLEARASTDAAPVAGEDVEREISGETVCGFRVVAYRETHPEHGSKYGHHYSEHWSTPNSRDSRVKVERLFTEDQLRAALSNPPAADAVPAAWIYERPNDGKRYTQDRLIDFQRHPLAVEVGWTETPLYAHPPVPDAAGEVSQLVLAARQAWASTIDRGLMPGDPLFGAMRDLDIAVAPFADRVPYAVHNEDCDCALCNAAGQKLPKLAQPPAAEPDTIGSHYGNGGQFDPLSAEPVGMREALTEDVRAVRQSFSNAVAQVAADAIRSSFFVSVSGEGEPYRYHLRLAYPSMEAMHKAEDALKALAKEPQFLPLEQRLAALATGNGGEGRS
jgi:hypothetical protein